MQRALARPVPAWSAFEIRPAAVYLGYSIGPAAGRTRWTDASNKFEERVDEIAAADPPVDMAAAHDRRTRALLVLGYLAQLSHPPPRAAELECRAVQRLWHLPGHTLAQHAHVELSQAGCLRIPSLPAFLAAAAVLGGCRGASRRSHPSRVARDRRCAPSHRLAFRFAGRVRPRTTLPECVGHRPLCGDPPRGQRGHAAARMGSPTSPRDRARNGAKVGVSSGSSRKRWRRGAFAVALPNKASRPRPQTSERNGRRSPGSSAEKVELLRFPLLRLC